MSGHALAGPLTLVVALGGVVVSIYYYFGWIKAAYFESWRPSSAEAAAPSRTPVGFALGVTLGALALFTVALGFYQGALGHWLKL